ncbi:hypothetical protein OSB04_003972 [Centaurea solstitialis]|uniref:Uncharacterized protein n=1 Tax=Centaurea solstitialis TaxID=347529 RepID=A0AA38U8D6_9ASTR|nr:hypothetical protein OSB04_003972 [Centaurea solstitialis]
MIDDDSLEDTASSPINSPKQAAYFDRVKSKSKNGKTLHNSKEKDGTFEEENKRRVLNPNMELKKRGLCLVPLSSLANYLS